MESPLSKAQLADIRRAAAECNDCLICCERAEAAGVDVAEIKLRAEHARKSLQQFLDVYTQLGMNNGNRPG